MEKKVLDATCGSRMIWFDKNNPVAVYVDKRELHDEATWKSGSGLGTRRVDIEPDILADFTALPFEDNSFYLVVFDPPHLTKLGESAWLKKKNGQISIVQNLMYILRSSRMLSHWRRIIRSAS